MTRTLILLPTILLTTIAYAAGPAKPSRLGLCAACHGEDGRARIVGAPNLAGQRYDYLLRALHDYRGGKRDAAVMRAATGPLSDAEMQQLARWYASLPCPPVAVAR